MIVHIYMEVGIVLLLHLGVFSVQEVIGSALAIHIISQKTSVYCVLSTV